MDLITRWLKGEKLQALEEELAKARNLSIAGRMEHERSYVSSARHLARDCGKSIEREASYIESVSAISAYTGIVTEALQAMAEGSPLVYLRAIRVLQKLESRIPDTFEGRFMLLHLESLKPVVFERGIESCFSAVEESCRDGYVADSMRSMFMAQLYGQKIGKNVDDRITAHCESHTYLCHPKQFNLSLAKVAYPDVEELLDLKK